MFFFFIALFQKESNRLTNKSEGIRSLNHLVCIPKMANHIIAYFILKFLDRKYSKA